jgi:hypothetical protein
VPMPIELSQKFCDSVGTGSAANFWLMPTMTSEDPPEEARHFAVCTARLFCMIRSRMVESAEYLEPMVRLATGWRNHTSGKKSGTRREDCARLY